MKNLFIIFILVFTLTNSMAQNDVIMRLYTPPAEKYGVIDTSGKIIVPFEYAQILPFVGGVACASKTENRNSENAEDTSGDKTAVIRYIPKNKWGLIDYTGNELVPFVYLYLQKCKTENRYIAGDSNNKCGVINKNGDFIIPFEYDDIYENEGLFLCKHNEKGFLVLDTKGKIINSTGYNNIGYAPWFKGFRIWKNGKEGLMNAEGQELILCMYDKLGRAWSEGMLGVQQNKKWGFIDSAINLTIPCEYKDEGFFRDGVVCMETEDKRVVVDKANKIVLSIPKFIHGEYGDDAYITREAYIKKGDRSASFKAALVDAELNNITPFQYDKIYRLSDKAYLVSKDDKNFGIINQKGKQVLAEEYQMPSHRMEFASKYVWLRQNGKFGLIDFSKKPKKILDFEYDDVKHNFLISKSGKWGAISLETKKIAITVKYDSIATIWGWNTAYTASQNGKVGIIDMAGNVILPSEYDNIEALRNNYGWYLLRDKGMYGLIHSTLNIVLPCKYNNIEFISDLNGRNQVIAAQADGLSEIIKASEHGFETVATVQQSPISLADNFIIVSEKIKAYGLNTYSGKMGIINTQGKEIVPCIYSQVLSYSDGYFVVREAHELPDNNNEIPVEPYLEDI